NEMMSGSETKSAPRESMTAGRPYTGPCAWRVSRQAGIVVLIAAYVLRCGSLAAKGAFPSRPLDRAQVLVWMDFGESTRRVKKLIERAGIDFEPTSEYLALLKSLGAPAGFVDAVGKLRPTGTPSR